MVHSSTHSTTTKRKHIDTNDENQIHSSNTTNHAQQSKKLKSNTGYSKSMIDYNDLPSSLSSTNDNNELKRSLRDITNQVDNNTINNTNDINNRPTVKAQRKLQSLNDIPNDLSNQLNTSTEPLLQQSLSDDVNLDFSTNISDYVNSSSSSNSTTHTLSPSQQHNISRSEQLFSPDTYHQSIEASPAIQHESYTNDNITLWPTVLQPARHINEFDDAILSHIFSYMSKLDIIHVTQTCVQWYQHMHNITQQYNNTTKQYIIDHQLFYNLLQRDSTVLLRDYMSTQTEFTTKMRRILMDWLLQVNNEFSNDIGTMSLTVRLCDCFLSTSFITRGKIQLSGVACLLISSKLIETHYPDLNELMYLCDQIYRREQLIQMEADVMKKLKHRLQLPSTIEFIRILYKSIPPNNNNHTLTYQLALYMTELTFLEYDMCLLSAPLLATAIYIWSIYQTQCHHTILIDLYEFTQFAPAQLNDVIQRLNNIYIESSTNELQHIQKRYSKRDKLYVALTMCDTTFALADSTPPITSSNWNERDSSIGTQRQNGRLD